jgi:hypothetical protein
MRSADVSRRTQWILWSAAIAWALLGLSGIHFVNSKFLEVVFFSGLIVGMAMLLVTGVHRDLNAVGWFIYVPTNAIVFYWLLRLLRRLTLRFRQGV